MLTLGVIGDFGIISKNSLEVSKLVKSWNPDCILTTGDNLYSTPTLANYGSVVGELYGEYLSNNSGKDRILNTKSAKNIMIESNGYKKSCRPSKFLPCVGNHDYPPGPYVEYFKLPTFYSASFLYPKSELLKVISLNSNSERNDGKFNSVGDSRQKSWLEKELEASKKFRWIIVTFHHPQLCSSDLDRIGRENGERSGNLFPFHEYPNVALILCGHQHIYERLEINGITNVVIGTGGCTIRTRPEPTFYPESIAFDQSGFGALKLEITHEKIHGSYCVLEKSCGSGKKSQTVERIKDQLIITRKD